MDPLLYCCAPSSSRATSRSRTTPEDGSGPPSNEPPVSAFAPTVPPVVAEAAGGRRVYLGTELRSLRSAAVLYCLRE